MENTSVSTCANPQCNAKFTRMGDGKLFVRPGNEDEAGPRQKVLWLCGQCIKEVELRYDRRKQALVMVKRHRAA